MGRKVSQKQKRSALRVKKITRAQALSYNRTIPNGIGVTAISAVNGRGAYSEFQKSRYEQTLKVLEGSSAAPSQKRNGSMKRNPMAAGFRYRPVMPNVSRYYGNKSETVRLPSRSKFEAGLGRTRKMGTPSIAELRADAEAQRRAESRGEDAVTHVYRGRKFKAAKTKVYKPKSKKSAPKKSAPKRVASKKVASKKVASKKAVSRRPAKRAASYRPLMARVGGAKYKTYLYHPGGKGRPRKIPSWALAGASSSRSMSEAQRKRLAKRRSEVAKRISKRIRAGTYPFTPNAGFAVVRGPSGTVTFKEWAASMKKTKKKAKKRSKKLHGAAKAAHEKKLRRAKSKAAPKKRRARKAAAKKTRRVRRAKAGTVRMAARKAPARKRRAKRSKRKAASLSVARKAPARKRHAKKKHHARKHSRRMRRNGQQGQITSYISNLGIGQSADQLVAVIKQGAVIAAGLGAHKVLTNLVVENVDFFKTMPYGKSVAALAVAAVGVPVSAKFVSGIGSELAVGMGAALVHTVLVDVLSKMGQSQAASYLGDYTEASKPLPPAAYGSYYEFSPGETYAGMGEYIETGASGFGDYMQAAAGMGDYMQAAAGMGNVMQAAAGMGSPALMQAAAGVGEYIVSGAQGIGEYEQVAPEYTAPAGLDEGIAPSLSAAEQALTIAEAAAGVNGMGNMDAALKQIVYPRGQALDIDDQPGGSRAGVFFGGNGVFGP